MALVIVIGDPIVDIFVDENGRTIEQKPGGALNTYANLESIGERLLKEPTFGIALNDSISQAPLILDSVFPDTIDKVWYGPDLKIFKKEYQKSMPVIDQIRNVVDYHSPWSTNVLIISDYNRGAVLPKPPTETICYEPPAWDMVIVDSRHRGVDPLYLRQTPKHCLKVWHCTGDEYDPEFAKQFGVVLHTNGPQPVEVTVNHSLNQNSPGTKLHYRVPVPSETKVVNTAGAGDTFVAAWTLHYLFNQHIYLATAFAIEAAQDVISKPYTSVTALKLRQANLLNRL